MAYLAPAEFVTKMVDAGESKLLMSTRDTLIRACADLITQPGETREQLTNGLFPGSGDDPLCLLELAFHLTHEVEPLRQKLRHEKIKDYQTALDRKLITEGDLSDLKEADAAVHRAIMVDDFAAEELRPQRRKHMREAS